MKQETVLDPDAVLAFLSDPASYPHRPDTVEVVQTHASYVALAGPAVYKVKKAVNLGFLDFSTLEKRRHFCEEEVRLNRRLCARIYEGVIPIRQREGVLAFDGPGEIVEYAIKMQKLEPGLFLRDLLHQSPDPELLDPVIDVLASFYLSQEPRPDVTAWGHPDKLRISTDENFEQTAAYVDDVIPRPAYSAIRSFTDRYYTVQNDLLERRRAEGHVLDCHGDLHTEHIHLSSSGVCIYDCIEFNERLRYIDVASDVAFLAMDLDFHGRPDMARHLIRGIAEQTEDPDLPLLADFYRCYRAYVRGKVECMRSSEQEVPPPEREASRERARRYFRLALRYAVLGSEPVVLVVMGGVGAGKSTLARALSQLLDVEAISSDRLRKLTAGVPLHKRGDEEARRRLYDPDMTEKTYRLLQQCALRNAREGYSTILDATFSKRQHRRALCEAMRRAGLPVRFVELKADEKTVHARLRRRSFHSDEISDARFDDYENLQARYEPPTADEGIDLISITTEGELEGTIRDVLDGLIAAEVAHE